MPSTYSNLKIQLMATGENNTTWGDVTNVNLGTALEEAIVGSADVTFASANVTLTLTNTNATQTARNMRLRCTGTTGGSVRNLVVPSIEKPYIVKNDCADSVVVKTAAGTGVTVPAGATTWVYSDGTNVVDVVNFLSVLAVVDFVATNAAVVTLAATNLTATNLSSSNVSFTGGSVSGTNVTSANVTITGGSISGVNLSSSNVTVTGGDVSGVNLSSSNVTITGGSITGITDLAVADGGTGASTEAGARTNLGATTLGSNLFTISNPGAITFPRFNADNTVSSLSAADFRTATGSAASGANTDITALDQDVTITATGTIAADSIGFRGLPQNAQTGAYTLALSDAGKQVSNTTGGWVIPANGSVAFPVGTTIVLFNNSGSSQTISITTDTLRQAGTANTGSRTLAQYGIATCVKVASTTWVVSGNVS